MNISQQFSNWGGGFYMYQKERMDEIYAIIKENGYVTVKYLVEQVHYSNATINRDLNLLEKQGLVKRSYGGVETIKAKTVPLMFRYHKMKSAKHKMSKKAAELVGDGDTIFIDGSTTTEGIGKYLFGKKDITVITNSLALALSLGEMNIDTICLGGRIREFPSVVTDEVTIDNARRYRVDKMFFSIGALSHDGKIASIVTDTGGTHLLIKTMMENSKISCCLVDHEKVGIEYKTVLCGVDDVDYLITDYAFGDDFCGRFKNTKIITVK